MLKFKVPGFGLVLLAISLIFLLSGCGQGGTGSGGTSSGDTASKGDPYGLYNKVEMKQTKDQVDTELGVKPEELSNDIYIYTDQDGYSVAVGFSDILSATNTKEVISKMIYGTKSYAFMNSEAKKNEITEEQATSIKEGMTYDQVKTALGSAGIETTIAQNYDGSVNVTRTWLKNGVVSGLSIQFSGADGNGTVALVVNL